MKNLILILILILLFSVVGVSQNKQDRIKYEPLSKNLDLKLIEKEFNRLYLNYQDSVFKRNKKYGSFLDSMVHCQLNYLLGKEKGGISHEQEFEIT